MLFFFLLARVCTRWARCVCGWVWWKLVPEPRERPAELPSWCQPGRLSVSVETVSATLRVFHLVWFTSQNWTTSGFCSWIMWRVYPSQHTYIYLQRTQYCIKGKVHQTTNKWKVGWCFKVHKTFLEFTAKQHYSIFLNSWRRWGEKTMLA